MTQQLKALITQQLKALIEFIEKIGAPTKEVIMNIAKRLIDEGKKEGEKKGKMEILMMLLQTKFV